MGLKQRKRFLPCRSDGKLMPLYYTYAPHCPLYWCCRDHGANAITGDLRFSTPHQCFRIIMQHLKDKHPDELTTNEAAVLSPFFVFLYNERTKMLGERWKVTPPPYIPAAQQPDAAPPPPYKEPIVKKEEPDAPIDVGPIFGVVECNTEEQPRNRADVGTIAEYRELFGNAPLPDSLLPKRERSRTPPRLARHNAFIDEVSSSQFSGRGCVLTFQRIIVQLGKLSDAQRVDLARAALCYDAIRPD